MRCTKDWVIRSNTDNSKNLIDRLLEVRGIVSEDAKHEFLHPLEITLMHPNAFVDMPKAVERIIRAIDNKEKILVYGDFDADGVTSTSVLLKTFRFLGAEVDYYIPNRETEGHGINSKAIVQILAQKKPKLIITVDNGISNVEEVKFINSFGRDVIITDHHEAPEVLPEAYAIINPKAMNALDEKLTPRQIEYLTCLAGVGVAFKLAQAVLEKYNKLEFCYEILPFVTVGTIADIVSLIGENRYFVTKGLELIASGKHYGLKRLLDNAGVNLDKGLTAEQVAFSIAPRVNASGRLDTVDAAIKLMTSDNKQEVEMAIITLDNYNKVRQDLCSRTFEEADEMWKNTGMRDNAVVLFNKEWHVGIVGIVASKFVEKYYKPAFIMTYTEETKQFRCSARGIKELDIYDILSNVSDYLDGFGGHQLAGGFSFSESKVSFEVIKKVLNKTIDEMLFGKKIQPSLEIDLELDIKDIDVGLVEIISQLEPFGAGNPSPVFSIKNLVLKQKKLMGATKEHLKLLIETPTGLKDCIWWSKGDVPLNTDDKFDLAFVPQLNSYNNKNDVQLVIKDIHADAFELEEIAKIKIIDDRKKINNFAHVDDYIKNSELRVSVFAEDRKIVEQLKPYKNISNCIINRQNASKSDVLMFFDYPCDDEVMQNLKQTVCATTIHYMNYQNYKADEETILKNFASMIRYSCNNLEGKFVFVRAASALGVSEEIIENLLEIFEDCGMIKIVNRYDDYYSIEFVTGIEISKAFQTSKYAELAELISTINDYKNKFMSLDLE